MIRGVPVLVRKRDRYDYDAIGEPVKRENETKIIENVLIAPASANEITDGLQLHGKKIVYTLGIPKGADINDWIDSLVEFWGAEWEVVGIPTQGIDELVPTDWNMKVQVARYE